METRTVSPAAYSVEEFCRAYGLGRSTLYKLWKAGCGPKVMHVGRRTLISAEAAEQWRRVMENSTKSTVL